MSQPADLPLDPTETITIAREIGRHAAPFAAEHDRAASFVTEGYEAIRELGYGAIAVPQELGGAGNDLATVCRAQAAMASGCANTALAIAMHQHSVLAMARRWRLGSVELEPVLRRVADGMILCSSGAADPLNPGVTGRRVDGGLVLNGRKGLASGCPGADLLATPIVVEDSAGPRTMSVLVPMDAAGVTVLDSWDAMGMRASGSNAIELVDVLVQPENIMGDHHPPATPQAAAQPEDRRRAANRAPGLLIAVTVIAAGYLGAAGGVRRRALADVAKGRHADDPTTHRHAGLMTHHWQTAWWALEAVLRTTTDQSLRTEAQFIATMLAKRQIVLGSIAVVETAMEMLGSVSYMRGAPYEQALRDVRAGITHPLAPEATLVDVGRSVLQARIASPSPT